MAKALAQFTITRTGEDYLVTLEDEDGETIEFTADDDMLDEISDAVEEAVALGDEEDLDEDEEDEAEEE